MPQKFVLITSVLVGSLDSNGVGCAIGILVGGALRGVGLEVVVLVGLVVGGGLQVKSL